MNYTPDLFTSAIKMLSALGIVLCGMLVVFYYMRRFMKRDLTGSKEKLIRVLGSSYIGVKKSISLVEVPGALLVVGITNDNISLLNKIEDKEILKRFKIVDEDNIQSSFQDHLHKLSSKFKFNNKKN